MKRAIVWIALTIAVFAIGCGQSRPSNSIPTPSAVNGKVIFEATCNKCHALTKIAKYKGAESWKAIVDRMINEHGAKVSSENAAAIVAHLEKANPKK